MNAGLVGSDDYLAEWRQERRACGEAIYEEVAKEAERLEEAYDRETLAGLTRTGGTDQTEN